MLVCMYLSLDENLNFMYVRHMKDRAKCPSHFLQVHGISPYPLHDRCRIGQMSFSIQHVRNKFLSSVYTAGRQLLPCAYVHDAAALYFICQFARASSNFSANVL